MTAKIKKQFRPQNILMRLYYKAWFRKMILPFIKESTNKTFIFIVGCYNSGTTLLNNILAAHDEISCLPSEGKALASELYGPEDFGWNRMWHMCRHELEISRLAQKPDPARLKKEWAFWFDSDKEFWLEKSVINSLNIDWLEENFEHPYFIWIIRNGYAVAEGIQRRTRVPGKHPQQYARGYPIELCARQWVVTNEVIEEKLAQVKHSIKVTYEQLTETPEKTMQRILDWLPVKQKSLAIPEDFTFQGQRRRIRNMNWESIERLTDEQIKTITATAREMLLRRGYQLLNGKP